MWKDIFCQVTIEILQDDDPEFLNKIEKRQTKATKAQVAYNIAGGFNMAELQVE